MSCYANKNPDGTLDYQSLYYSVLAQSNSQSTFLVFMNISGQSYAFAINDYTDDTTGNLMPSAKYPTGAYKLQHSDNPNDSNGANLPSHYTLDRQGQIRLAMASSGTGSTLSEKITNSSADYYIDFDLSVPNNQSLKVVK